MGRKSVRSQRFHETEPQPHGESTSMTRATSGQNEVIFIDHGHIHHSAPIPTTTSSYLPPNPPADATALKNNLPPNEPPADDATTLNDKHFNIGATLPSTNLLENAYDRPSQHLGDSNSSASANDAATIGRHEPTSTGLPLTPPSGKTTLIANVVLDDEEYERLLAGIMPQGQMSGRRAIGSTLQSGNGITGKPSAIIASPGQDALVRPSGRGNNVRRWCLWCITASVVAALAATMSYGSSGVYVWQYLGGLIPTRPVLQLTVGPVQQLVFNTIAVDVHMTKPGGIVHASLFLKDESHGHVIRPLCPPDTHQMRSVANTSLPAISQTPCEAPSDQAGCGRVTVTVSFGARHGVKPDTHYILVLIAADTRQRCQRHTFHATTVRTQADITPQKKEMQVAAQETLKGTEQIAAYATMNAAVMLKSSKVCAESAHVIVKAYEELLRAEDDTFQQPSASTQELLKLNTRLHNAAAASRTLSDDSKHIFIYIAYDIQELARRVQSAKIKLSNAIDAAAVRDPEAMKGVMAGVVKTLQSIKEDMDSADSSFYRSQKLHKEVLMMSKEVGAITKDAGELAPSFIQLKQMLSNKAARAGMEANKLLQQDQESWLGKPELKKQAEILQDQVIAAEGAVKAYDQVVFELQWLIQEDFRGVQEQYKSVEVQYVKSRDAVNKIASLVMQSADFATPYFAEVCRELLGGVHDTLQAAARKMSTNVIQA